MKIYVDYDDCLCETARAFTGIAARLFGKNVPYEKVHFFNLQETFRLTDEEYRELMKEGHLPEVLRRTRSSHRPRLRGYCGRGLPYSSPKA